MVDDVGVIMVVNRASLGFREGPSRMEKQRGQQIYKCTFDPMISLDSLDESVSTILRLCCRKHHQAA